MAGDLGPGADPHPVGLLDAAIHRPGVQPRLAVGPHALLERALQLRLVGLADQVDPLVVERGVEEEAVVLELEVAVGLPNAALAQGDQLLALGERAHGDGPFLECDWHEEGDLRSAPDCLLKGGFPARTAAHSTYRRADFKRILDRK